MDGLHLVRKQVEENTKLVKPNYAEKKIKRRRTSGERIVDD
jgi:hypothetical protein